MQRLLTAGTDQFPRRAKSTQRQRELCIARHQRTFRRLRQGHRDFSGAGEGIEQDRCGSGAADKAWYRRTIRTSNPDPDGDAAVEADRPGIAVAIAGTGLERDPAVRGVLRRRRTDQHVADLPRRDLIHQPQGIALVVFRDHDLPQRPRVAEPRQPGIELHQVLQRDADATETHRKAGRFVLWQHQIGPCLFQSRRQTA